MSKKDKKADPKSPFAGLEKFREAIVDKEAEKSAKQIGSAASAIKGATSKYVAPKPVRVDPHEEEVSFHRLMSGVEPLAGGQGKRLAAVTTGSTPTALTHVARRDAMNRGEEDALAHLRSLVAGGAKFEVTDDGAHVEGRRHETLPELVRKLRRGQFPIDARLDLHGMIAEEAKSAVVEFVSKSRARKERCVLVICGQGIHSSSPGGVLRGEIAAWLSQGSASHAVAAFTSAAREDGGAGAVYVLLLP